MYMKYYTIDGIQYSTREYIVWNSMVQRCTKGSYKQKSKLNYVGCEMSEMFKDFQCFSEWANIQVGFNSLDRNGHRYHIDKDILGNGKFYSEDVCVFVPNEINNFVKPIPKKLNGLPTGVLQYHNKYLIDFRYNGERVRRSFLSPEAAYEAYKECKAHQANDLAVRYKGLVDERAIATLLNYRLENYIKENKWQNFVST